MWEDDSDHFGKKPPSQKKRPNRFFEEAASSTDESDLPPVLGAGQKGSSARIGADDAYPDFSQRITMDPKPGRGAVPTLDELQAIADKRKKKEGSKGRPQGAKYDDIKPGNNNNEPDPDNEPANSYRKI